MNNRLMINSHHLRTESVSKITFLRTDPGIKGISNLAALLNGITEISP